MWLLAQGTAGTAGLHMFSAPEFMVRSVHDFPLVERERLGSDLRQATDGTAVLILHLLAY